MSAQRTALTILLVVGTVGSACAQDSARQGQLARIWMNEPQLVRLARDHFDDALTETDARFYAAVAENGWADFRPAGGAEYDAETPASWNDSVVLPADRITWLCTDPAAVKLVPSRGIWLRGVKVVGQIDLYRSEVPFSLTMYDCLLEGGMNLAHAKLQELDVRNCCSAAVQARGIEVDESVCLRDTAVFGGVDFIDARVGGDFDFAGGLAFHGTTQEDLAKPGIALTLYDAHVGGDVRLADEFQAFGEVRLLGVRVGRSINCRGGEFRSAGPGALDGDRCQVEGNVYLGEGFEVDATVTLRRARIGGDLDCDGGKFSTPDTDALSADTAEVGGTVYLGDGFTARGEVRLINATVAGEIDCDDGHFLHPDGDALSLDGAKIGRNLRMSSLTAAEDDAEEPAGFLARGTVRMVGAQVGQDLLCNGSRLEAADGIALLACNMRVDGRVVFGYGFSAKGTVNLFAAEIARDLDCRGSRFDAGQSPEEIALYADGLKVGGHFYANRVDQGDESYGFQVIGQMNLQFATIGMYWDLYGAELTNPDGDALEASDCHVGGYVNIDSVRADGRVSFSRAKVDGMWVLENTVEPERLQLDLRFAHFWVIKDQRLADWPPAGQLQLEGLVYDHFDDDSPLGVEDRLAWLALQYEADESAAGAVESKASDVEPEETAAAELADIGAVQLAAYYEQQTRSAIPSSTEPGLLADLVAVDGNAVDNATDAQAATDDMATSQNEPTEPDADPAVRRYVTQPYTQLASVYRSIGQDEQANRVLVARAERIGELAPAFSARGVWYRYIGRLIGYGYEPFRAVKIGAVIILVGTLVFAFGAHRQLMAETKLAEHVFTKENDEQVVSPTYPRFNPLVYSLDVFLPFVDLQQICYWLPGERRVGRGVSRNCLMHVGPWSLKWSATLRMYFWFQTLAGWTLTTLLAAAVTGIVQS